MNTTNLILKQVKPRGPNKPKPGLKNPDFFSSFVSAATGGGMITLNKKFYSSVKIRQKRWGLLMKGEVSPEIEELSRVADYFKKNFYLNSNLIYAELFDIDASVLKIEL